MGGPIDMKPKEYESIGCQTHILTLTKPMTLTLDIQGQCLK